jgi:hypothetical protein
MPKHNGKQINLPGCMLKLCTMNETIIMAIWDEFNACTVTWPEEIKTTQDEN